MKSGTVLMWLSWKVLSRVQAFQECRCTREEKVGEVSYAFSARGSKSRHQNRLSAAENTSIIEARILVSLIYDSILVDLLHYQWLDIFLLLTSNYYTSDFDLWDLLAAYQLPVTSHQSPVTSHQSPVTSHQSPVTSHKSPATSNQLPVTSHQSPVTSLKVESCLCDMTCITMLYKKRPSLNWSSLNWSSLNWSSLNWPSLNWSSLNWPSLNWSSLNWPSLNWPSLNWSSFNWSSLNWSSLNWSSLKWPSSKTTCQVNTELQAYLRLCAAAEVHFS